MKDNPQNILLTESDNNGILRLTLNDPDNKNALSELMIQKLTTAISEASINNSLKVIVIASTGDVFCSGHNLKEINEARDADDNGESYYLELFKKCSFLMQTIVDCSSPVIAEVDGIATAAGCQLVASCDLAIASDISKFATPGVNIGLFCSTPMVALSRNINKKDAMKMLLTGDLINAEEAKRISLVNDCLPKEKLTESVMQLAKKISKKSQVTLKTGKKAFYKQYEMTLADAYDYTSKIMTENTLRADAKEGINAFIQKRDPSWEDNQ